MVSAEGEPEIWEGVVMKDKRILITGANGFVGAWVAKHLCQENTVIALVRDPTSMKHLKSHGVEEKVEIVQGDVSQLDVEVESVDYCFHLAAVTDVSTCQKDPSRAIAVNIGGTRNVLNLCERLGVKGLIAASSTKVYGEMESPGATESEMSNPTNVYGLTKAYADLLVQDFHQRTGIPSFAARLSNIYGPHDLNTQRLVPSTALAIKEGKQPSLFGDGTTEKMFVYIRDVVEFLILCLEKVGKVESGVYNVGASKTHSTGFVVEEMTKLMGWDRGIEYRKDIVPAKSDFVVSLEKAARIGWKPRTLLEEGLKETIAWYKEGSQ